MMSPSKEPWLKNYEFFKAQLPSLMQTSEGKFALVRDERILNIFDTEELAREYIKKNNFILGSFLIQEITDRVEYISRLNVNS